MGACLAVFAPLLRVRQGLVAPEGGPCCGCLCAAGGEGARGVGRSQAAAAMCTAWVGVLPGPGMSGGLASRLFHVFLLNVARQRWRVAGPRVVRVCTLHLVWACMHLPAHTARSAWRPALTAGFLGGCMSLLAIRKPLACVFVCVVRGWCCAYSLAHLTHVCEVGPCPVCPPRPLCVCRRCVYPCVMLLLCGGDGSLSLLSYIPKVAGNSCSRPLFGAVSA
jgi:hypothetical protein